MTTARNDTRVTLAGRHAHLWWIRPDTIGDPAELARCRALLTDDEREKTDRFRFARDRQTCLITRVLVRTTLSRYCDVPPARWRFRTNDHGRPEMPSTTLSMTPRSRSPRTCRASCALFRSAISPASRSLTAMPSRYSREYSRHLRNAYQPKAMDASESAIGISSSSHCSCPATQYNHASLMSKLAASANKHSVPTTAMTRSSFAELCFRGVSSSSTMASKYVCVVVLPFSSQRYRLTSPDARKVAAPSANTSVPFSSPSGGQPEGWENANLYTNG